MARKQVKPQFRPFVFLRDFLKEIQVRRRLSRWFFTVVVAIFPIIARSIALGIPKMTETLNDGGLFVVAVPIAAEGIGEIISGREYHFGRRYLLGTICLGLIFTAGVFYASIGRYTETQIANDSILVFILATIASFASVITVSLFSEAERRSHDGV